MSFVATATKRKFIEPDVSDAEDDDDPEWLPVSGNYFNILINLVALVYLI